MRFIYFILLFACCVGAAPEQRADRIIVKPKPGLAAKIAQAHQKFGGSVHRQFNRLGGLQVIKLPRGMTVEKALAHYRKLGLFEYVQPDYVRHIVATPNDPYFPGSLYGLVKIGCTNAWDVRTNADTVIVAVIDTGARLDHEDLVSNLWSNPCVSCPVNGVVYTNDFHGINTITGTGDPTDDHGHGTHTAGTVGAAGNNSLGVCGVAWRVQLMPLKFIAANGSGNDSDAVEAIEYAIAKGAHIMSNSWGGYGDSPAIYDAIRHARDAGIIFVAAAGNDGTDIDNNIFIPAGFDLDNIVSVAATDSSDNRAGFSNYGREGVDLGAPGVGILSTTFGSTNSYGGNSGTSMACPHVAGAFALVKAEFPTETYTQLIHRVFGTVDPLSSLSNITVTGGRLNVFKALTQIPKPLADFTPTQQGGYTINFNNRTIGTVTNVAWDFGDGGLASAFHSSHTYSNAGAYAVTLTVAGPGGTHARSHPVTVGNNYYVRATAYNWINPTGMTPLALTDDSSSSAQTLPFAFVYYGQTNTTLYVGSNGLLGFNSANLNTPAHTALPKPGTPNNLLAPYWADLDPGVAGTVYVGTTGTAPDRVEVISWVGVPNFNDNTTPLTFQVLLYETSHDIVFQYLEVQPTNALYGASHGATVGIENSTGTIGRQISYQGSTLLTNNQAIRFTLRPPAPLLTGPASPATNLTILLTGTTEPFATIAATGTNTADATGAYSITVTVATNSLNTFTAQSTDTAGNSSALSVPITYRHLTPTGDADGDGTTNLDELTAGTDPLAPASYPHILSVVPVTISSVTNRTYQLQVCEDLPSGIWTNVGAAVIGDGSILTLPDAGDVPKRFYRVKISP
ncbi:MAG: S8 family serine peptidase [Verrucomicrobiota bacterium]